MTEIMKQLILSAFHAYHAPHLVVGETYFRVVHFLECLRDVADEVTILALDGCLYFHESRLHKVLNLIREPHFRFPGRSLEGVVTRDKRHQVKKVEILIDGETFVEFKTLREFGYWLQDLMYWVNIARGRMYLSSIWTSQWVEEREV